MDAKADLFRLKADTVSFAVKDGIVLRPIFQDDVTAEYVDGLNDAQVRRYLGDARDIEQSLETVTFYVNANAKSPNAVLFGVFVDAKLCGTVRLHDIDFNAASAIVGIALFEKSVWGKGIGRAVLREVCHIGQTQLGLCVLSAGIRPANEASKKIFGASGFTQDEYQRDLWVCRLNTDRGEGTDQSTVLGQF